MTEEDKKRSKSPIPLLAVDTGKVEVSEHLKTLVRKRAGYRSRLSIFKSHFQKYQASDELSSLEIREISLRLVQLQELMSSFDRTQTEIEELSQNLEDQILERDNTDSEFYKQIALAQELIDLFSAKNKEANASEGSVKSSCCHLNNTMTNPINLPVINLPTFDGSYTKWLEFRDTFKTLIHDNGSITPISKFHYLRNSLQSGASVVIRSLEFAASNYELAWKALCDRYNNKNILINNHLNALVGINAIQKESFKALRYLSDQVYKHLNALNTLEISTVGWDPLVIFLVSAKLDSKTSGKWEEHKGRLSQLPTLDEFRGFLENRANVLETANSRNFDNKPTYNNNNYKDNKSMKTFATFGETSFNQICPVCNEHHYVYQCSKFKALNVDDRIREVTKHKLCSNCLRSGHLQIQCTLKGSCRICKKKHNTILHKGSKIPTENKETQNASVSLSAVSSGQVLLCTALLEVTNIQNGTTYLARALLDTGSQSSFITKHLKERLGLQSEQINAFNVSGISGVACPITERCQIEIRSLIGSFNRNVNCFIIPKITNSLPNVLVNVKGLGLPDYITLADPTFYKPSEIDILLGADHFFDFIKSDKICLGQNKPTLQDSVFGWLVAGPTGAVYSEKEVNCNFVQNESSISLQDINNSIKRFWEVEELPSDITSYSSEEQFCESHFVKNTHRLSDGRFSVMMPLKEDPEQALGNSFPMAMRQTVLSVRK